MVKQETEHMESRYYFYGVTFSLDHNSLGVLLPSAADRLFLAGLSPRLFSQCRQCLVLQIAVLQGDVSQVLSA